MGTFDHKVLEKQYLDNNFEKSDLLYAPNVSVSKGDIVNLHFKHLMSCMTVKLKSNVFSQEQLEQAEIIIRSYNEMNVNSDGKLVKLYDYLYDKRNMSDIVFQHKGSAAFQAILCPQNPHNWAYSGWWLKIKIAGKEFYVSEPPHYLNNEKPFEGFKSGENYIFTYTFNERYNNKLQWVYGLKEIPKPFTGGWEYYVFNDTLKSFHLPWYKKYGWYDCNKKDPAGPSYGDQNLCWAATSSNMIHWWLEQNKEYVDRFCELNKVSVPQNYDHNYNSEVFATFVKNFEDKGSHIHHALNWFFLGEYRQEDDSAKLLNSDSGAFFKDVFTLDSKLVEVVGISKIQDISDALKKAFTNNKAIGFCIEMKGFGSAHAMTIWGANFDQDGKVNRIFYVDNNDEPLNEQNNVGLLAAKIGEYQGTDPQLKGTICMENSQGKTSIPITQLVLLDLGKQDWNIYFQKKYNKEN